MRIYTPQEITLIGESASESVERGTPEELSVLTKLRPLGVVRVDYEPLRSSWVFSITPRGKLALRCHAAFMAGQ